MRRYDTYDRLDDPPKPIGDRGFIGVNMRVDPAQLPPGYASEAINMRFRNGVAETRKGYVVLPWVNKIVAGQTQPWGQVHGTGVFSDPFTFQEYLVIAADGSAYYTQANNTPQTLTLPASETLSNTVTFTQAFDTLIMHRGTATATLQMPRITQGFSLVEQTPSGNGTEPIPNSTHSLFLQNRLFIPNDNDEIAASDFNDYTRYLPVFQEFKVNQGSADELVAIFKFNDTTLIAFKEHSIYALNNVYGDLNAIQQDELTNQFGLVARQSVAHVGKDLWFLSELGVMSIAQTEQNKLQGVVLPVSDPIQPLIDRINWRYASSAVAAVWDSKYYLAVPLDDAELVGDELLAGTFSEGGAYTLRGIVAGATYRFTLGTDGITLTNGTESYGSASTGFTKDFVAQGTTLAISGGFALLDSSVRRVRKGVNNAILVYDFLNQAWCGHDEAPGFAVSEFRLFPYNGERRLFVITVDGYMVMYEEDVEDQLPVPYTDVTAASAGEAEIGAGGQTLRVNGGTIAVASAFDVVVNSGTQWGAAGGGGGNLWADVNATPGYAQGYSIPGWTAPNTQSFRLAHGVRFYATNGVIPAVVTNAEWLTIAEHGTQPIETTLVTRGYSSEDNSLSDYNWLIADLQTWAPEYSLSVVAPGVNEVQAVKEDETKDRTAYYEPAHAAAFDPSNVNGDFLTPYRQDYSVLLGDAVDATEEFALYTLEDGVPMELHQEHRVTERLNTKGRSAQVRITNSQGRIRVMSVTLEADEKQFSAGARA